MDAAEAILSNLGAKTSLYSQRLRTNQANADRLQEILGSGISTIATGVKEAFEEREQKGLSDAFLQAMAATGDPEQAFSVLAQTPTRTAKGAQTKVEYGLQLNNVLRQRSLDKIDLQTKQIGIDRWKQEELQRKILGEAFKGINDPVPYSPWDNLGEETPRPPTPEELSDRIENAIGRLLESKELTAKDLGDIAQFRKNWMGTDQAELKLYQQNEQFNKTLAEREEHHRGQRENDLKIAAEKAAVQDRMNAQRFAIEWMKDTTRRRGQDLRDALGRAILTERTTHDEAEEKIALLHEALEAYKLASGKGNDEEYGRLSQKVHEASVLYRTAVTKQDSGQIEVATKLLNEANRELKEHVKDIPEPPKTDLELRPPKMGVDLGAKAPPLRMPTPEEIQAERERRKNLPK